MLCEDPPLCEAFAHVLVAQIHQNLVEEKMTSRWGLRTISEIMIVIGAPFPEGLYVWKEDFHRSSQPRPEFSCGAPRGRL